MPHLKGLAPLKHRHQEPPPFASHQTARASPQVHFAAVPTPAHLQNLAALKQLHGTGVGAVLVGSDAQLSFLAAPPHEDDVGRAAQLLQSNRHSLCSPISRSYQGYGKCAAQPLLEGGPPQDSNLRQVNHRAVRRRCCSAVAGMQAGMLQSTQCWEAR